MVLCACCRTRCTPWSELSGIARNARRRAFRRPVSSARFRRGAEAEAGVRTGISESGSSLASDWRVPSCASKPSAVYTGSSTGLNAGSSTTKASARELGDRSLLLTEGVRSCWCEMSDGRLNGPLSPVRGSVHVTLTNPSAAAAAAAAEAPFIVRRPPTGEPAAEAGRRWRSAVCWAPPAGREVAELGRADRSLSDGRRTPSLPPLCSICSPHPHRRGGERGEREVRESPVMERECCDDDRTCCESDDDDRDCCNDTEAWCQDRVLPRRLARAVTDPEVGGR
jgi:hypothetical protein